MKKGYEIFVMGNRYRYSKKDWCKRRRRERQECKELLSTHDPEDFCDARSRVNTKSSAKIGFRTLHFFLNRRWLNGWLLSRVGQSWSNICAQVAVLVPAGHRVSVLDEVDKVFTNPWMKSKFVLDEQGVLRVEEISQLPKVRVRWYHPDSDFVAAEQWLANRVLCRQGGKMFWLAPIQRNTGVHVYEVCSYRQDRELNAKEYDEFNSLSESEQGLVMRMCEDRRRKADRHFRAWRQSVA